MRAAWPASDDESPCAGSSGAGEGNYVDLEDSAVQVNHGLRAQGQMESIVTGQLYVELSYRPVAAPPELEERRTAWPAIPTTPSLLAALGTGAGSLVADILRMASAEAMEELVASPELQMAFEQLPGLTAQATRTMDDLGPTCCCAAGSRRRTDHELDH